MAGRGGRGWGRGRGGRGTSFDHRIVKHEPYILFPEDVKLPPVPDIPLPSDEKLLIHRKIKLELFWKTSCYHLEEVVPKSKKQDADIERYSDRSKKSKTQSNRESLASYLKLSLANFPSELIQGTKRLQASNKKLRWGRNKAEQLSDMFEKLEEKYKENDASVGNEKKGESEDEDELEDQEEESSDEDDYTENVEFDDDEDDCNIEEGEDEDCYE